MNGTLVGVMGGTFDPIHCGHLDAARAVHETLGLDRILLVPSRMPPHRPRTPHASAYHRFAMTALAAQDAPYLVADDLELQTDGPSYTAHTLARLAASGHAPLQIVFITGVDAFAEIATWHDYPRVLDAAHFAVVARPGHALATLDARVPALRDRLCPARRLDGGAASLTPPTRIFLVDASTADVSSTAVRATLARGGDVSGLVPQLVGSHIARHQLYRHPSPQAGRLHEKS